MNNAQKSLDVFCSISSREVKKINSYLIPSLKNQIGVDFINLFLINYTGKERAYKETNSLAGKVRIKEISNTKSMGFGEAHNFAFKKIQPKGHFVVINPDVYLNEDCFLEMMKATKDEMVGIVEARQLPFEHPKEYDKSTFETPWASGFCILVDSVFFKKSGGFDENYWMYCEDVDLSWRAWLGGYKVVYAPMATAYHFTGAYFGHNQTRFYLEHYWSARNFVYISYKFFGEAGERKAIKMLRNTDFPENLKKSAIGSFLKLKKNSDFFNVKQKKKIKELKDKIKIVSYNQYHDLF